MGKQPAGPFENPVCIECRKNGNQCLLDLWKAVPLPITAGAVVMQSASTGI